MSSSSILRPEILVIGNRSYRINPSSLPGLESVDTQQHQVYREEEETDYYIDNPNDDDEPSCKPQQKRSTIELEEKPQQKRSTIELEEKPQQKRSTIELEEKPQQKRSTIQSEEKPQQKRSTIQSEEKPQIVRPEEPSKDDDTIDYFVKEKMFIHEMDIAPAFYGVLIGKNAENKQKLEQDTNTRIIIPRHDEVGLVKIRGRIKANVQSARNQIEIIIERNRQMLSFTHFLSIPICQPSSTLTKNFQKRYQEFKKNILEQCSDERGITNEIFQKSNRLHLTIGTLVLLSKSEIDFIKDTLQECTNTLLKQFMPTDNDRFIVQLKGLEFMNDDPSFVDVLYAKVQTIDKQNSNRLQNFLDRLNQELLNTGLMKQKFERIKLHVTLINSLLRKDDTGILEAQKTTRGKVKNYERESFDAKKILQLFGQYDFGQIELNELHLSIMHQPDQITGYYGYETKILLKPIN